MAASVECSGLHPALNLPVQAFDRPGPPNFHCAADSAEGEQPLPRLGLSATPRQDLANVLLAHSAFSATIMIGVVGLETPSDGRGALLVHRERCTEYHSPAGANRLQALAGLISEAPAPYEATRDRPSMDNRPRSPMFLTRAEPSVPTPSRPGGIDSTPRQAIVLAPCHTRISRDNVLGPRCQLIASRSLPCARPAHESLPTLPTAGQRNGGHARGRKVILAIRSARLVSRLGMVWLHSLVAAIPIAGDAGELETVSAPKVPTSSDAGGRCDNPWARRCVDSAHGRAPLALRIRHHSLHEGADAKADRSSRGSNQFSPEGTGRRRCRMFHRVSSSAAAHRLSECFTIRSLRFSNFPPTLRHHPGEWRHPTCAMGVNRIGKVIIIEILTHLLRIDGRYNYESNIDYCSIGSHFWRYWAGRGKSAGQM